MATQSYVLNRRGSEIVLNPSPGTLGITISLAVQASGYSTFVIYIRRTLQAVQSDDSGNSFLQGEAIDAMFHMCALASSSVKLSGSMRPILVMRVLKGFGAAKNGAT